MDDEIEINEYSLAIIVDVANKERVDNAYGQPHAVVRS